VEAISGGGMKERKTEQLAQRELRILKKWQKQGIDSGYVVACLLYARLQTLIVPDIDEKLKSFKHYINTIEKGIKKLEEAEKIIESDVLGTSLTKTGAGIISKEIMSLKKNKETCEKVAKLLKCRNFSILSTANTPAVDVAFNMPIVLAYNLLTDSVGIYAYGREKSVPQKYQKDLLFLFSNVAPQHFPRRLPLNTLAQRISYMNKNHPKLVKLCKEQLLKFVTRL
jgi:hypothetical protein